jgi:hypothetical protein
MTDIPFRSLSLANRPGFSRGDAGAFVSTAETGIIFDVFYFPLMGERSVSKVKSKYKLSRRHSYMALHPGHSQEKKLRGS